MPVFDYRCSTKRHVTFERLVKRAADPVRCPCGDRDCRPERLISAAAFTLKGTGWYKPGHSG